MTPARYASGRHILTSRESFEKGPLDDALEAYGLTRKIVTLVGGFSAALAFARASDRIATVPDRHTEKLRVGMYGFPLPIETPGFTISMLWHPRMDGDSAHRWLRGCLHDVCAERVCDAQELEGNLID